MFAFDPPPVPTLCLPERHIIHIVLVDENIREPVHPSQALPCPAGPVLGSTYHLTLQITSFSDSP
jgi:hypothetical protein